MCIVWCVLQNPQKICYNSYMNCKKCEELLNKYRYDSLTGMKLRHDYEEEIQKLLDNDIKFYYVLWDVNNLHKVNRDLGYSAGDKLIKMCSNIIKDTDFLIECYRIGGDEFVSTHSNNPVLIPNKLMTSVTVLSGTANSVSELVDIADVLLTKSKYRRRSDR